MTISLQKLICEKCAFLGEMWNAFRKCVGTGGKVEENPNLVKQSTLCQSNPRLGIHSTFVKTIHIWENIPHFSKQSTFGKTIHIWENNPLVKSTNFKHEKLFQKS